jgi:hypothetical protein
MKITIKQLKSIIKESIRAHVPLELGPVLIDHEEKAKDLLLNLMELYTELYLHETDLEKATEFAAEDLHLFVDGIIKLQKDILLNQK